MKQLFHKLIVIVTTLMMSNMSPIYSQSSLYTSVSAIDSSKATEPDKLKQLYYLKQSTEEKHNTGDSGYILALLKIAIYESNRQEYAKASVLSQEAIQKLKQFSYPSQTLILKSYYNTATFFFLQSYYDKAAHYFDTVIELSSGYDPDDYLLNARYYSTTINDQLGDYEKVIDESQLGLNESILRKDTSFYITFLYFAARSLMIQDKLTEAENKADEYLLLSEKIKDQNQFAIACNIKAWIYRKQKNYGQAEAFFKKAIEVRSRLSKHYSYKAIDYNDLGVFYMDIIHDGRKAKACFNKVMDYASMCLREERSNKQFIVYGNIASLYSASENPLRAIEYYQKALQIIHIEANHFITSNPSFRQLSLLRNKENLLDLLSSKCSILLELYKRENKRIYLQSCINTAAVADSLITQMRYEELGEKSKLYWRSKTRSIYSDALQACYLLNNIDSAFYFMEKSRAVLLTDKLNELKGKSFFLAKNQADKQKDLQRKIISVEEKLTLLSPSSFQYKEVENTLLQTKEELEKFIRTLEQNNPGYYQLKYVGDIPSLRQLKNYVAAYNQSYVCYYADDTVLYALGISKNETRFIKIPSQAFDSRQLSQFTNLCSNRQETNSRYTMFSSLSHNIYHYLFEPLQLPAGDVIICTDNFFIPFDALCSDEKGKDFLLYHYNFSYTYSARTLLKPFKSNSKPEGNFIGFAPVSFSKQLNVFPLNSSASALEKSADCYGKNVLFTNQTATRNSFFKYASRYSVLTIFSHAQADTTDKEPVLYMQDSLIHLSELQMLDNPATQFVLLSACQTNTGKSATGEGIYSLARGFAAAGIPSVSATLWKADEETVYQISEKLNENLAKGMNKSEALQQAKIWYLQNSNREHGLPFYWANLVLIGSSDPVFLMQSNHTSLWLIILLSIVVLAVILFIIKYKKIAVANNTNQQV